jgi:hypothetical protein
MGPPRRHSLERSARERESSVLAAGAVRDGCLRRAGGVGWGVAGADHRGGARVGGRGRDVEPVRSGPGDGYGSPGLLEVLATTTEDDDRPHGTDAKGGPHAPSCRARPDALKVCRVHDESVAYRTDG